MERLYTEKEMVANGYGSHSKLRTDRMKGIGIPFVYVGSAVRYRESDVNAWLERNKATGPLHPSNNPAGRPAKLG